MNLQLNDEQGQLEAGVGRMMADRYSFDARQKIAARAPGWSAGSSSTVPGAGVQAGGARPTRCPAAGAAQSAMSASRIGRDRFGTPVPLTHCTRMGRCA